MVQDFSRYFESTSINKIEQIKQDNTGHTGTYYRKAIGDIRPDSKDLTTYREDMIVKGGTKDEPPNIKDIPTQVNNGDYLIIDGEKLPNLARVLELQLDPNAKARFSLINLAKN